MSGDEGVVPQVVDVPPADVLRFGARRDDYGGGHGAVMLLMGRVASRGPLCDELVRQAGECEWIVAGRTSEREGVGGKLAERAGREVRPRVVEGSEVGVQYVEITATPRSPSSIRAICALMLIIAGAT